MKKKTNWTAELLKDLKRKPLKKDSYDLEVKVFKAGKCMPGTESACCERKPAMFIAFIHKNKFRQRVTKFLPFCRTHFEWMEYWIHKNKETKERAKRLYFG